MDGVAVSNYSLLGEGLRPSRRGDFSASTPFYLLRDTNEVNRWLGDVDEFAVYKGVLSQAEIVDHYNNGAGKYYASATETPAVAQAPVSDYKTVSYSPLTTTLKEADQMPLLQTSTIASFTYDGDGRQVKAVVGSTTTYYIGAHYQVDNGVVTKYYFAGAQRVAMRKNGTLSYLLADHLGSTSLTTNTSGELVSEMRYKAWGETRHSNGTTPTNYRYTGQREEPGIGLYFYNARWYDPYLNHFTQPDSIVPDPYNPQDWDRYSYARNNPLRYTDPSGHNPWPWIIGGSALVITGSFILSAVGATPDYWGAAITMAFADTDNAVVAASLTVQSQYPWAMFTGSGLGMGQLTEDNMNDAGLAGQDRFDPSVAVEAMDNLINKAVNKCKLCTTGYDKLIVAAITQNNYKLDFASLPVTTTETGETVINWDAFFGTAAGSNTGDFWAQIRQDVSGLDYNAEFMVKLYIQDLRLLMRRGYKLPEWAKEDDVKYIEENYID